MTGDVSYYGGRLTPTQAYAAQHGTASAVPPVAPPPPSAAEQLALLDELRAAGTVTEDEYESLRSRIEP